MGYGNGCCSYCGDVYGRAHIVNFPPIAKGMKLQRRAYCSPECIDQDTSTLPKTLKAKLDHAWKRVCKHDWNDIYVFKGRKFRHARAVCDLCGRVAFERGHAPEKPVYLPTEDLA